jgi:adenylate cyclase
VARPPQSISGSVRELLRTLGASDTEIDEAADTGPTALIALGARGLISRDETQDQEQTPPAEPEAEAETEPLRAADEHAIVELLTSIGASEEDIERARSEGTSALFALAADRLIVPGSQRLTRKEVAEASGMPEDEASTYWRAMGFADVSDDDRAFTEVDVEMLRLLKNLMQSGFIDRDAALQMTRVMGRSMASVAAAQLDLVRQLGTGMSVQDARREAIIALVQARSALLEVIERSLVYMWRRHLADEAKRTAVAIDSASGNYVVGFADLVGFTALSAQMDAASLGAAVSRFEATAVEIVAGLGGRLVKMIGDEVMFEASSDADGVEIALRLVEAFSADETLPDVRAGVADGVATPYQGDLYGPAPNLAHRLVEVAFPASVIVSSSIQKVLSEDARYEFHPVRPQVLKGFGRTRIWVVRRRPE